MENYTKIYVCKWISLCVYSCCSNFGMVFIWNQYCCCLAHVCVYACVSSSIYSQILYIFHFEMDKKATAKANISKSDGTKRHMCGDLLIILLYQLQLQFLRITDRNRKDNAAFHSFRFISFYPLKLRYAMIHNFFVLHTVVPNETSYKIK